MDRIERLHKDLKSIYIKCWIVLFILGICITKFSFLSTNEEINVSLESFSVCLTLLGIWGTYVYHKKKLKSLMAFADEEVNTKLYKKLFITCIFLLFGILLFNIVVFSFLRTISGIFAVLIPVVAILLLYPGKYRLMTDLEDNNINKE